MRRVGLAALTVAALASIATAQDWQPIGPRGGTLFALENDPHQPGVLYGGSYFGGLYRSVDAGRQWLHVPSPFSNRVVFAVAPDPTIAGTLYVGTLDHGIFKSTDAGATWAAANQGLVGSTIEAIAVDPNDSNLVLACNSSDLFRSTDAGASWVQYTGALALGGRSLLFDPTQPGVVYSGTYSDGVYRSTDGGSTWQAYNLGMGPVLITGFDLAQEVGGTVLYAAAATGLFRLPEGTATWEDLSYDLPAGASPGHMVRWESGQGVLAATKLGVFFLADAANQWTPWFSMPSTRLLLDPVGEPILIAGAFNRLVVTPDQGQSFFSADRGLHNRFVGALETLSLGGQTLLYAGVEDGVELTLPLLANAGLWPWFAATGLSNAVFDLTSHPTARRTLYASAERNGVWRSGDLGATWAARSRGMVPYRILAFAQATIGSATVYAGTTGGAYVSRSGGLTWQPDSFTTPPEDVPAVCTDASLPGVAYYALGSGALFRTIDDGVSFQAGSTGIPGEGIEQIVSSPFPNLFVVTSSGQLHASDDLGDTFYRTAAEITVPILTVAVDLQRPGTVFAGTSSEGVYKSIDNGLTWTQSSAGIGVPFVFALAFDPDDTDVVYAGSVDRVYRTSDGGATWTDPGVASRRQSGRAPAQASLPAGNVTGLSTDPLDGATVYATVEGAGIYRSMDAGQTWALSADGMGWRESPPLLALRSGGGNLLAGPLADGVQRSADGGASWQPSSSGMTLFVRDLVIDTEDPRFMYAASLQNGLFRSMDGSLSWSHSGLERRVLYEVDLDPTEPSTVFASTATGVARSLDAGTTWVNLGQQAAYLFQVVTDPVVADTLYVSGLSGGLYKSTDGGNTWLRINADLPILDLLAMTADPSSATLYVAAERQGVYRSDDGGTTWSLTETSFIGSTKVTSLHADPLGVVFAGTQGNGLFRSTAGGQSWIPLNTGFTSKFVSSVNVDPRNPFRVFVTTLSSSGQGTGLYLSRDHGWTWQSSSSGIGSPNVHCTALGDGNVVFAAADDGVYRSDDAGLTWTLSNTGLTGVVRTLLVDPSFPQLVHAGTMGQGIYRSPDGGTTWSLASTPGLALDVTALKPGDELGELYASSVGRGLVASADYGATWTDGVDPLVVQASTLGLAVDPLAPNRLYAATSGRGVLRSTDGGIQWATANQGLGSLSLFRLLVDPGNPQTVFAATADGGVYRSLDGASSWQAFSSGLLNLTVTSLALDPNDPTAIYAGTEGGGVFHGTR